LRQRGDGNVNGSCGYHGVNTGMTENFEGISQGREEHWKIHGMWVFCMGDMGVIHWDGYLDIKNCSNTL